MRGTISVLSTAALLLVLPAMAQPSSSTPPNPYAARLEVSGEVGKQSEGSAYHLFVSFEAASIERADALLIYAEPEHILLYAHVDMRQPELLAELKGPRQALAITIGDPQMVRASLSIPYHANWRLGDERIEAFVRRGHEEVLIARIRINAASFRFTTTMKSTQGQQKIQVCCQGTRCTLFCRDCADPTLTFCDLANCQVYCSIFDAPTLGEQEKILFVILLCGAGLLLLRRKAREARK